VNELEHIPPLRGPRPAGTATVSRKAPRRNLAIAGATRPSRRSVLRGAVASGMALGFTALGVFPAARRAYADGYDIKGLPCPSYAGPHNCSPGCGPSIVYSAACGGDGWHRVDGNVFISYSLRPNQCYGGWADGWLWRAGGCAGCGTVEWRCHDGWIRTCTTSGCVTSKSICRTGWCV
jgi:hypothetical protein